MKFVQPIRDKEIIADIRKRLLAKNNKRDYILFSLGINCGFRISDILPLRVYDLKKRTLQIREKKTKKWKTFEMNTTVRRELLDLVKDWDDMDYLIKSREGVNKPLTRSMTYKILRKLTERYNIDGSIGNHTLRKTYGYHFYMATKDVVALQKIFNHSDPSITLRYIGYTQDIMGSITKKFRL
ncbi:tyrosine-type recombinase/integrase [Paenibacillus sp. GCM10012307]|uniref:Tyrosine-type recombinase/integrase n=1 Tax=Paenibacillus roseus TaxID=2798579 RepID=A0A934J899_9BACL|nr:tyrosine-type recombinase/integrase [Paenibacillus roseus]MBJ6362113.1 tyrosine-type recombinase/integrase [Paenibacillus roseus]